MRKFFLLLVPILAFLFLTPFVIAQEKETITTLSKDQTINTNYFGAGSQTNVSGTVNGDAYIAGGVVVVDGTINGDLLVAGGNVTITGKVTNDVRAAGGSIKISGADIGGNLTIGGGQITIDKSTRLAGSIVAGGGNLEILAPVSKDATIGGGNVLIGNSIEGNVLAGTGQLTLSKDAQIRGDLTYWSDNKARIAEGASVSGRVKQEMPPKTQREQAEKAAGIFAGLSFFFKVLEAIALLAIGLLFFYFTPVFMDRTAEYIRGNFGWSLLIGFIAAIVIPAVAILLAITILGIPLAFLVFIIYIAIISIAKVFSIYALGLAITNRTRAKERKTIRNPWAYVLGVAVYFVLMLIPVVSFFTKLLVIFAGLGGLLFVKKETYQELRSKKII